jgi:hypothetical protein
MGELYARQMGHQFQVGERPFKADPMDEVVPGQHLFIVAVAFRTPDPAKFMAGDGYLLDQENLLQMSLPGCYVCEQEWTPELGSWCPGDPQRPNPLIRAPR